VARHRGSGGWAVAAIAGAIAVLLAFGTVGALELDHRAKAAAEPIVIGTEPGGYILDHFERFEAIRRGTKRVVVDGICISACTLVLATIPPERLCVTPFAKFAFHSATRGEEYSSEGTRISWNAYPEHVRAALRKRGWDGDPDLSKPVKKGEPAPTGEHKALIYIDGTELAKACEPK
jgi:hypothetical protein